MMAWDSKRKKKSNFHTVYVGSAEIACQKEFVGNLFDHFILELTESVLLNVLGCSDVCVFFAIRAFSGLSLPRQNHQTLDTKCVRICLDFPGIPFIHCCVFTPFSGLWSVCIDNSNGGGEKHFFFSVWPFGLVLHESQNSIVQIEEKKCFL